MATPRPARGPVPDLGRGYNPPRPPGQAGLPGRVPPPKIACATTPPPPPVPGVDYNLLRSWLGLPAGPWPPDHHTLLGLAAGRVDVVAAERRVMERMDWLRRHQLLHPDLVTEGMNKLAQALITLTDPVGTGADARESELPPPFTPVRAAPPSAASTVVIAAPVFDDDIFSDDQAGSAPHDTGETTRVLQVPALPGGPEPIIDGEVVVPLTPLARSPPAYEVVWDGAEKPPRSPDVVEAVALDLPPLAATPTDRRWLYRRLAFLRKARRAWERFGPVLGDPGDPLDRPGRVLLVLEAAAAVRPLLADLRGVVGGVGEPGGIVGAVAAQPLILDTLRRLQPGQREALAIDWRRGQEALSREYERLRDLSRRGRNRPGGWNFGWRTAWQILTIPETSLALLALLALLIATVRYAGSR